MSRAGERNSAQRALAGSIASIVSVVNSMIIGIIFPLIALRYWSGEQYGYWAVVFAISGLFTVLDYSHQTYVGNLYTVLLARGENTSARCVITGGYRWAIILVFVKLILVSIYILISGINVILFLAIPLILTQILTSGMLGMGMQVYRPHGEYARTIYLQAAWQLSAIITVLLLITTLKMELWGAIFVYSIIKILAELLIIIYTIRRFGISLKKTSFCSDREGGMNLYRSLPYLINAFLDYSVLHGSVIILERLAGATQVGLFTTVRTLSNSVIQSMTFILWPVAHDFVRMKETKDRAGLQSMFGFAWLVTGLVAIPVAYIIILYGDFFFQLWTKGKYGTSAPILGLLSGAAFFRMLSLPPWTYYQQFNKTNIIMSISGIRMGTFFSLAALVGASPTSFAVAALASEFIATSYLCWKLSVDPELTGLGLGIRIVLPWWIGIAWLVTCLSIPIEPSYFLAISSLLGGTLAVFIGWLGLDPETHIRIKLNIRRLMLKFN